MKKLFISSILAVLLFSCGEPQQEFTHSIIATDGITNAELTYIKTDIANSPDLGKSIVNQAITQGDFVVQRVEDGNYIITVTDQNGSTIFTEVPAKYINLDATLEVTRNIFQDYFPEEWEAMKGSNFTSIYFKSKLDNQVFYLKTVFTGTDKEIGMHSEDF